MALVNILNKRPGDVRKIFQCGGSFVDYWLCVYCRYELRSFSSVLDCALTRTILIRV